MAFKFEKLEVWMDSVELSGLVHKVCLTFPKEELYILVPQIKRAADSVSLNIAEGSTGQSNPEFKKFLSYSIRSGVEVVDVFILPISAILFQTRILRPFITQLINL